MNTVTTCALDQARQRLRAAVGDDGRLGVQMYASLRGEPLWETAVGELSPGTPMTVDDPLPWLCACKPVTVLALGQLYDEGLLDGRVRVAEVVPEFAVGGKEDARLEHLLTHTLVYDQGDDRPGMLSRADALACVCGWRVEAEPGARASYSAFANWLMLSEIIQRLTGRDFYAFVRERVLDPLGMHGSTFFAGPGEQVPPDPLFERTPEGDLRPFGEMPHVQKWPGSGLWGPARELARPFECVVAGGTWRGERLLSPDAVEHFFTPYRTGVPDEYFEGLALSWSRGVCTDRAMLGAPHGARVVGHTGLLTSLVAGDMDHGLVVAYLSNTVQASESPFRRLDNTLVRDLYGVLDED
jgi:CubicO group peptidase (beta-lactamase class C family)